MEKESTPRPLGSKPKALGFHCQAPPVAFARPALHRRQPSALGGVGGARAADAAGFSGGAVQQRAGDETNDFGSFLDCYWVGSLD